MIKLSRITTLFAAMAALTALLPLSAPATGPAPAKKAPVQQSADKVQLGLQLYSVRDMCAKDFVGTVKAVAKMGFNGVEFAGYYGKTAQEIKAMLDENHLKCYGTHIGLDTMQGDNLAKTIEFNKIIGNNLLIVAWIPQEMRNTKAKILETGKIFNDIATKLKPHGMTIAFHNHADDFRVVEGEIGWETFFANTDKNVQIQFDTGNALQGGQQAAPYLKRFPGRVVSVHVKDFSGTKPSVLLGEGDVSWKDVIPEFKARRGPRRYIIEQETYPFPSLDCAEKCLRTFEQMMNIKR